MTTLQQQDLLTPVVAIAQAAGQRIMQVYQAGFDVWQKDDHTPLTEADQAAHAVIKEQLTQLAPTTPLLSEEGRIANYAERSQWQQYWLIDPLDGTKEFIKRNDEFTVNIALIRNHVPVLGVVHAPALDKTWYAAHGVGAFKIENGTSSTIQTRSSAAPTVVMVSRSHRGERIDALLQRMESVETQAVGSSLKFCLVAEGKADLYPRFGPTSEWDSAAAQCVVEQAGGQVTTLDLQPLRYNTKASLLNPDFLVFGDNDYDWSQLLQGLHGETR